MRFFENASAVREAERLIAEAQQTGAQELSLSSLRIRRLPKALIELAVTLKQLDLSGCGSLTDVSVLTGLTGLQLLDLRGCWSLSDLSALSGLTGLQKLSMPWCGSLSDVNALSGLFGLQHLDLSGCVSLSDINALSGLTGLQHLDLGFCQALSKVSCLAGLNGLQQLSLHECDALIDVSALAGLTGLQHLDLGECGDLSDISALSSLTGLRQLDLSGCRALCDVSALSNLTGLRQLDLSGCRALSDVSALSNLTGLRQLDLSGCEALSDVSALSGLTGLQYLDLSECGLLSDISSLSGLTGVQHLDLSGCGALSDVRALSGLTQLQQLDLARCDALSDVTALASLKRLQQLRLNWCEKLLDVSALSGLTGLQELDLASCDALSDVTALTGLTGLLQLNLSGCGALSEVSALAGLTGLQQLGLRGCGALSDVSALSSLTGLQYLTLSSCDSLRDVSALTGLTGLQHLDLSSCDTLSDVSALTGLTALQHLNLSGCGTLGDICALASLTGLQHLDLRGCGTLLDVSALASLTELQHLDLSGCETLGDVSALANLTELQYLDLSGCGSLRDVNALANLTGLQRLRLSWCWELSDIGALAGLTGLRQLDLRECVALSDVSALAGLTGLQHLDLRDCVTLGDVSALAGLTSLQQLDLGSCPNIAISRRGTDSALTSASELHSWVADGLPRLQGLTIDSHVGWPNELLGRFCLHRVESWLIDLAEGACECRHIKLMVLGNGRAGKTQIVRRLRGLQFDGTISSTHGIQTSHVDWDLDAQAEVTVHIWDFGGQDLYLGTHSMFVDDRAICLLVWASDTENENLVQDGELQDRNRLLPYWTGFIKSMAGPEVPVIVTQAKCDLESQVAEPPVPQSHGFARMQRSACSARVDGARGMERLQMDLRSALRYQQERQKLSYLLPKSWMAVADALQDLRTQGCKTVSYDDYLTLCRDKAGVQAPQTLLHYLHESGTLFWRDGVFEQQLVLDQAWALEGVYALLHRQKVLPVLRQNGGRFSKDMLALLLWSGSEYNEAEQDMFLDMMERCGICFDVGQGQYIAPDALPEREQVKSREFSCWGDRVADAVVYLDFDFLHDGVARTVLSRLGENAGPDALYWRFGCCVHDGRSGTLLRMSTVLEPGIGAERQGAICIETAGSQCLRLAKHLVESVTGLVFGQRPRERWERRPAEAIEVPKLEKAMDLDDCKEPRHFELVPRARPAPSQTTSRSLLYVSYAWDGGSQVVEDIQERLSGESVELIRDQSYLKSGDSISRFEKEIGKAPHVLIVLSAKYLRSPYCMRELVYVHQYSQRDPEQFLRRVIPVVVDGLAMNTPEDRLVHLDFWEKRHATLKQLVEKYGADKCGVSTTRELQDIASFLHTLVDALAWMADLVMPRGFANLSEANYEPVLNLIRQRLKAT